MEKESKELIVLNIINSGVKKFNNIAKASKVEPKELNSILERLEARGLIKVQEKKSWLGTKIEMTSTEKGSREVTERIHEMQERWGTMSALYKSGDKKGLKQYMDDNRSFLPMMMFFGIMDIMMFSMMFSMLGMSMGDFIPSEDMPEGVGDEGSDGDYGDDGGFDDGGFDIGF